MEPVEVFRKTETDTGWEFAVEVGHDSGIEGQVGFLVHLGKPYWADITKSLHAPEEVVEQTFHVLLSKHHKSTLPREFALDELKDMYPEVEEFLHRKFEK